MFVIRAAIGRAATPELASFVARQIRRYPASPGQDFGAWADTADVLLRASASLGLLLAPEAPPLAMRLLAELRRPARRDTARLLAGLTTAARIANAQRARERAMPLLEEALRISEAAEGPRSRQTAGVVHALGALAMDRSDLPAAERYLLREVAIRDSLAPREDNEHANALSSLSQLYRTLHDYPQARHYGEAALAMRRKLLGPDNTDVAISLTGLANLARLQGEPARALPLLHEALRIRTLRFGPVARDVALTESILGQAYGDLKNFPQAFTYLVRAESTYDAAGLSEDFEMARCRVSLAGQYYAVGEVDSARAVILRTVGTIADSVGAALSIQEMETLRLAADVMLLIRDYALARPVLERRYQETLQRPTKDSTNVAQAAAELATVVADTRDLRSSLRLYRVALGIEERSWGVDSPRLAKHLHQLGTVYADAREYTLAEAWFARSVALMEGDAGRDSVRWSAAITALGTCARHLGRIERADSLYRRALDICSPSYRIAFCDPTDIYEGLAQVAVRRSRPGEARAWAERALEYARGHYSPGAGELSQLEQFLAASAYASDSTDAAVARSLASARTLNEYLRRIFASLSEREALGELSVQRGALSLALDALATRAPGEAAAARTWDVLIRQRASVLDELARQTRSLRTLADGPTDSLLLKLGQLRSQLAMLYSRPIDSKDAPSAWLLDSLRHDAEITERSLGQRNAQVAYTLELDTHGFDDVVRALPDSAALVAFAFAPPVRSLIDWDHRSPDALYALILAPGSRSPTVIRVSDGDRAQLLVRRYRNSIQRNRTDDDEARYRANTDSLRREIWDPIAARLGRPTRLFLVPDGCLSLVDFGSLPADGNRYLLESLPPIHYLSAERDLCRPRSLDRRTKTLLAVGDVDFQRADRPVAIDTPSSIAAGSRPAHASLQILAAPLRSGSARALGPCARVSPLTELPATRIEVERVLASWRRATGSGSRRDRMLRGAAATEAAFKVMAPAASAIHIATHGLFLSECPTRETPDAETGAGIGSPESNPLLRAGLAFAGANRESANLPPGEEDGFLSAAEIASLDLRSADWVVLSACETGVGETLSGEGVLGLRRAFQVAGAGSLVMSLWEVGDRDAAHFMSALYQARFGRAAAVPEAMRSALLAGLQTRRSLQLSTHPANWAGFISSGPWR